MSTLLTVVIPAYNRGELLGYALESVARATGSLAVETLIVDDGSTEPVDASLASSSRAAPRIIRQENRGLLFARLRGLSEAAGRYVLFLDSDDLVRPDKFTRQLRRMEETGAEVSYCHGATCVLAGDYGSLVWKKQTPLPDTSDAAELFIRLQPAPHSPIFSTEYLRRIVRMAPFAPSPLYNPVAEIWFYYVAALHPVTVCHVPDELSATGLHATERLSGSWERLGLGALAVMEAFARATAGDSRARPARQLASEAALRAWRALPSGFSPVFMERMLALARDLGPPRLEHVGGPVYRSFARLLGWTRAARLLARQQRPPYESVRTMTDAEFTRRLAEIPTP